MTDVPELWWSPTHGLIQREDGVLWLLAKGPLLEDGDAPLPADVVKLGRQVDSDERHQINLGPESWVIMHPLSCRPNLFECPFNEAAPGADDVIGVFYCELGDAGQLIIGGRAE